jgi:simple sugar transport system permease protein
MITGAFGSWFGLSETLVRTVPVLLCALAAAIPAEGGQINIGGEGQLYLGAIGAVAVAGAATGSAPGFMVAVMVVASVLCGALWAAIPGALRSFWGINEALVTLFLNYVAFYFLQYLVHGPLRDPASLGWPMSPDLPVSVLVEPFQGTRLHSGIFVAFGLAVLVICLLRLTRAGAELRAVGVNFRTAEIVRIPVQWYLLGSLVIGGALAGLAGYYEIVAIQHRLRTDVSLGFGYSGFLVAWMCRGRVTLMIPLSILVSGLATSAENLQISTGLPASGADVVQGLLLLFVLLGRPLLSRFERLRAKQLVLEAGR